VAKTIVITGVTRGIGRGLAGEFARLGHKVIGCGRSADQVAELQTALGQAHDFAAVDVTDDRASTRKETLIVATLGSIGSGAGVRERTSS